MTSSGLKKLWNELRSVTGLTWFRPYDTRHTAITRMAERGMPIALIMARAGHVSARMSEHYTHISLSAQRKWERFTRAQCEPKTPPIRHGWLSLPTQAPPSKQAALP